MDPIILDKIVTWAGMGIMGVLNLVVTVKVLTARLDGLTTRVVSVETDTNRAHTRIDNLLSNVRN